MIHYPLDDAEAATANDEMPSVSYLKETAVASALAT